MKNEKGFSLVEMLIFVVFVGILATGLSQQIESRFFGVLDKDVDMRQVPMIGRKIFRAQIEIIYIDGKFESVKLVPKTTVPVMEAK